MASRLNTRSSWRLCAASTWVALTLLMAACSSANGTTPTDSSTATTTPVQPDPTIETTELDTEETLEFLAEFEGVRMRVRLASPDVAHPKGTPMTVFIENGSDGQVCLTGSGVLATPDPGSGITAGATVDDIVQAAEARSDPWTHQGQSQQDIPLRPNWLYSEAALTVFDPSFELVAGDTATADLTLHVPIGEDVAGEVEFRLGYRVLLECDRDTDVDGMLDVDVRVGVDDESLLPSADVRQLAADPSVESWLEALGQRRGSGSPVFVDYGWHLGAWRLFLVSVVEPYALMVTPAGDGEIAVTCPRNENSSGQTRPTCP